MTFIERLTDMRLFRFRITVRLLLIAVSVIALALGAEQLRRRRSAYLERAKRHATLEAWYHEYARLSPDVAKECRETAAFYGRLRAKYERAASRPWLALEPDSPPPGQDFAEIEAEMDPEWNATQRSIYTAIKRNGWRYDIRLSDVARLLDLSPEIVAREMDGMFGILVWERAKADPEISIR
jgi:hypothetical protein